MEVKILFHQRCKNQEITHAAHSTWLINAFRRKTLCFCAVLPDTPAPAPTGFLIILPPFLLQVPLAHDIFGLIGPNAGLGISIGKKYP